jgi:hypothetical protein
MALTNMNTGYERKRRSATTARDASLAQNAYSRFLSQQRGARQTVDLNKSMTQGLQGFASGFGRRGLRNSGLFQQAQNDYSQNWLQGQQDVNDQVTQAGRQADFSDANAWNSYYETDADIEAQKAADILAAAAQLKQLLGG